MILRTISIELVRKRTGTKKIWVKSGRDITQQRLVRGFLYFGLLTFGSQFKLTN